MLMAMGKVVRDQRVVDFVGSRTGGSFQKCIPVGWEDDFGNVVAGAVFERCNGHNVFFHGAAETGKVYNRAFLKAIAFVAFVELGVQRVTAVAPATNKGALHWDLAYGFKEEARLAKASHDGSDAVYLVLWKDECKWLVR